MHNMQPATEGGSKALAGLQDMFCQMRRYCRDAEKLIPS
jgi:hypothetical protein